ncbi:MAG: 50S ribosomal protein L3 [Anaerolineae bacterium]|nr:50S ribosomal protein L3 [Anaerolineae bacterium]
MKKLIGRKVGMTQLFDEKGNVTGVTVIEAGPNYVTQIKTTAKEGYDAIQLGFGEVQAKKLSRGELGHLGNVPANAKHPNRKESVGIPPLKHLHENRSVPSEGLKAGDLIKADIFKAGEFVDISGKSKGRGFAGNIKRHGFHRQKKTHGASDRERAPGSIGAGTGIGHVEKGTRMAGHFGDESRTSVRLKVMMVDVERNLIAVAGSIPGANGGVVVIREAKKQ